MLLQNPKHPLFTKNKQKKIVPTMFAKNENNGFDEFNGKS